MTRASAGLGRRTRRVAITGCGWVCPAGAGSLDHVITKLAAQGPLQPAPPGAFARVRDELLQATAVSEECSRDRLTWLAAVAFVHACEGALTIESSRGLHSGGQVTAAAPAEQTGLCIGCALAGQLGMIDFAEDVRGQSARFVSPIRFPQTVGNYASGALARAFDIRGPVSTVACGTASGLQAVIEACRWLDAGLADAAFAGGCETFSEAIARELQSSVPLAEGACLFALEREADARVRGARILASIDLGTGSSGTEPPTQAAVMASAGAPIDGSVFLETWTGCALAASGAAAIGGVIAARAGRPVPYHGAAGATLGKESGGQAVAEPSEPVRVVVGGHQGDSVWIELF